MNFYKRLKENLSQNTEKNSKRTVVFFFLTPLVLTVLLLLSAGLYNFEPQTLGAFFMNLASFSLIARIILNYIVILSFQCLVFALCYKPFLSSVITGSFLFLFDFINQVMAVITGDPLLPTDLLLAGNLEEIASFIKIPFQVMWTVCVILYILYEILHRTALKHSNFKVKTSLKPLVSVFLIVFFAVTTYFVSVNHIFRHRYMDKWGIEISAFNPVENYRKNGAILTFLPRIGDLIVEVPENYSENTINDIVSRYRLFDIDSEKVKPNVIAIQNEAWWDPTIMPNAEFSTDPMAFIRSLSAEKTYAKTGTLVSPVFAGGTCLPEFEFLTGMSTLNLKSSGYPYIQYVTNKTPSFIWEYKNNGYETLAIHPYKIHFYSRDTAYPLLGFDKFFGDSDMYYNAKAGSYITDDSLSREIIRKFEEKTSDRVFIFGVSMQNHGGYGNYPRYKDEYYKIDVKCDNMDDADLFGFKEYTQGVYDTDLSFKLLCDYFSSVDEPTLIVMYGDHLPLLGNNGSTYIAGGMPENKPIYYNSDVYYETPFVVWANYDISGISFPERMSASALGMKIYKMSGLENTPDYLKMFNILHENISVYDKRGLYLTDGTVFGDSHEAEFVPVISDYKMLQYDLLHGKKYALGE